MEDRVMIVNPRSTANDIHRAMDVRLERIMEMLAARDQLTHDVVSGGLACPAFEQVQEVQCLSARLREQMEADSGLADQDAPIPPTAEKDRQPT